MMYGHNIGSGGWMFSIFVTLIVLALLAAVVIWIASNGRSGTEGSPSASEILDRRLATGDHRRTVRRAARHPHRHVACAAVC